MNRETASTTISTHAHSCQAMRGMLHRHQTGTGCSQLACSPTFVWASRNIGPWSNDGRQRLERSFCSLALPSHLQLRLHGARSHRLHGRMLHAAVMPSASGAVQELQRVEQCEQRQRQVDTTEIGRAEAAELDEEGRTVDAPLDRDVSDEAVEE